ncbi:MAG: HlyD family efflux transporter periplasmic adaptor subunit [Gammaproteobacteria bacterium]|nr:HlyD family efflux transporter periplasmic adaptor subunit [Gammaproteobacteria bacterium]
MLKRRFVVPALIIGILILVAVLIVKNPPKQPSDAADRRLQMAVSTMAVTPAKYQVVVESYGRIEPVTKSFLVAQVGGQIVNVSQQFENGRTFDKGDALLRIDNRDYRANLKVAEAALLDAKRVLIEEQARGRLAKDDWRRSGKSGEPDSLVLREPQLLAAKAGVLSAEASLDKAKLDLSRTVLRAPYSGRVLARSVDLGQVVSVNERLGEIYSSHALQVRLPLRNRDLAYVKLENGVAPSAEHEPDVRLLSSIGESAAWPAHLTRTEAAIDDASRQLHVVAELRPAVTGAEQNVTEANGKKPDSESAQTLGNASLEKHPSLPRIGQYVTAHILGTQLGQAIVVPLQSVYQGSFVYLVEDGHVYRRGIEIAWQNQQDALIKAGLQGGEQLVVTPIGQVVSGTPVKVVEDLPASAAQQQNSLVTP